jgi:hypothetical protein
MFDYIIKIKSNLLFKKNINISNYSQYIILFKKITLIKFIIVTKVTLKYNIISYKISNLMYKKTLVTYK